jgi:hypothetical protein
MKWAAFSALSIGLLILASCGSVPVKTTEQWLGVLPQDATIYMSVSVRPSAAMFRKALTSAGSAYNDISTLFDMTDRMYIAVTLVQGGSPEYSIVAVGNYPTVLLGWRLGSGTDWKPMKSDAGTWYEAAKGGLQLGLPAGTVLLISNGGIERLLPRLQESNALPVPPEVNEDMNRSDLVVFLPKLPGEILDRTEGSMNIPIREVWLDARRNGAKFEVGGTASCTTEKEAKLLSVVMRLVIVAWLRTQNVSDVGERLKSVSVSPEGSQVLLSGLSFTEDEVIPLFLSLITGMAPMEQAPR